MNMYYPNEVIANAREYNITNVFYTLVDGILITLHTGANW